jgi:predicted RNase H-like HicB family nuclease
LGSSVINLNVRLEAAFKKEGRHWLAWCPALDVMTQAGSRPAAMKALKEAVELWFESCIERGVLDKALREAGFRRSKPGEAIPRDASVVELLNRRSRSTTSDFSAAADYIEVSIPAYIAARQSESRAAR